MAEVVPIRARERVELPLAPPPAHRLGERLPWRFLSLLLVPAAALAAAAGLQRWIEGPLSRGDALLRWVALSSGLGLCFGALAGALFGKRRLSKLAFALWGLVAPLALALGSSALVESVRPLRDAIAARAYAACSAEGRPACSLVEFQRGCSDAARAPAGARELARARLGAPAQELCDPQGCTTRFRYQGPWQPDNWVAPGAVVCSVVSDAKGRGLKSVMLPGTAPP